MRVLGTVLPVVVVVVAVTVTVMGMVAAVIVRSPPCRPYNFRGHATTRVRRGGGESPRRRPPSVKGGAPRDRKPAPRDSELKAGGGGGQGRRRESTVAAVKGALTGRRRSTRFLCEGVRHPLRAPRSRQNAKSTVAAVARRRLCERTSLRRW